MLAGNLLLPVRFSQQDTPAVFKFEHPGGGLLSVGPRARGQERVFTVGQCPQLYAGLQVKC
jgi:hypothetical protein